MKRRKQESAVFQCMGATSRRRFQAQQNQYVSERKERNRQRGALRTWSCYQRKLEDMPVTMRSRASCLLILAICCLFAAGKSAASDCSVERNLYRRMEETHPCSMRQSESIFFLLCKEVILVSARRSIGMAACVCECLRRRRRRRRKGLLPSLFLSSFFLSGRGQRKK
jgi:hypothetical protein